MPHGALMPSVSTPLALTVYTHRYLNIYKVSLHVAMSMLSYLATALAHLKADDYVHMRHMRISPNPPMGGMKAGQIGMREPTREKAWAPLGPM